MIDKEILKIYETEKALLRGHFVLSSGKHSSIYLQSALVLSVPNHLNLIANYMVSILRNKVNLSELDLIVSPAMGGIIIGNKIGELLNKKSIFLERVNGKFTLRRGFNIKKKQRILIVEDVITTGKSSKETIDCIKEYGGNVKGLTAIIDRSSMKLNFNIPYITALKINAPIYDKSKIPDSLRSKPEEKPGSRFIK